MLNDYVVIDLETTGLSSFDCIIEVAAMKIKNNQAIAKFESLVKPFRTINSFIENLTGITNDMVSTAPNIQNVLGDLCNFIGDSVVIAHNANFDISFITGKLSIHLPDRSFTNDYIDTMRLSRRVFHTEKRHRLKDLVQRFELNQTISHRAMADCEITNECYQIIKNSAIKNNVDITKKPSQWTLGELRSTTKSFNEDHPFYEKTIAFTGAMQLSRKEAMQSILNVGGIASNNISRNTDFLVLGDFDYRKFRDGIKSNKLKLAEDLILQGYDLSIIPEKLFHEIMQSNNQTP